MTSPDPHRRHQPPTSSAIVITDSDSAREGELSKWKDRLKGAWRVEHHTAMSGTPQELADAEAWSVKVEAEFVRAFAPLARARAAESDRDRYREERKTLADDLDRFADWLERDAREPDKTLCTALSIRRTATSLRALSTKDTEAE